MMSDALTLPAASRPVARQMAIRMAQRTVTLFIMHPIEAAWFYNVDESPGDAQARNAMGGS
jgi:hypothetical protein